MFLSFFGKIIEHIRTWKLRRKDESRQHVIYLHFQFWPIFYYVIACVSWRYKQKYIRRFPLPSLPKGITVIAFLKLLNISSVAMEPTYPSDPCIEWTPCIITLKICTKQRGIHIWTLTRRHVLTLYNESSVSEAIWVGRDIVDRYSLRSSDIRSLSFWSNYISKSIRH